MQESFLPDCMIALTLTPWPLSWRSNIVDLHITGSYEIQPCSRMLPHAYRLPANFMIACEAPLSIDSPWPKTARWNSSLASFFTL